MGVLKAHHLSGTNSGVIVGQMDSLIGVLHTTHVGIAGFNVVTAVALPSVVGVHLLGYVYLETEVAHSRVRVHGAHAQVEIVVVYAHGAHQCCVRIVGVYVVVDSGAGRGSGLILDIIQCGKGVILPLFLIGIHRPCIYK